MNCTAINSNQIETTPNNHHHSRLMRGAGGGGVGVVGMLPMVTTPLSTVTSPQQQHHQHQQLHHRTAKASICMSAPGHGVGSVGGSSSGGSVNIGTTTVFFHRTTNNLLDVPPPPNRTNSSEEENSPTELNTCRKLAEKPPLVKRLTMGILRTAEDSRPLVHSSSSPSSSSSSSQTISDGYVNEGICADTAETSLTTNVFSSKIGSSSGPSPSSPAGAAAAAGGIGPTNGASCSSRSPGTAGGMGHMSKGGGNSSALLLDGSGAGGQPRYNHTATTLLYPPAVPIRNDSLSLKEQHELKGAPWFQAGIPREISLEVLSRQNPGAFLVRQSTTKPGCFALSLRVPPPAPKVAHYLILRTIRGYKIKGFTKEFTSLRALITHHSVMPELLPVPLALPRPPQLGQRQEDPETYGSLNDFQNMITE
ncbi:EGFR adapter protein-like [Anopheles aquasalis]|uniref:EGFR adapter protein-like n=1 Tax=Anopheles aquasalis TaxID=42839 RepID=UPI00215ABAD3|nr:EGFR adapter protein-like [Anopheles aquasalis]